MKKLITYSIVALFIVLFTFNYSEARTRKKGKTNVTKTTSNYTTNSIPDIFNLASYENYIKKNGTEFELETSAEGYSSTAYKYSFLSKENVVFVFYKKKQNKENSPDAIEITIPINDYDDGEKLYVSLQSLISDKYGIDYDSMIVGYNDYERLLFFEGSEVLSKRRNIEKGISTRYRPNFSDVVDSKYVITVYLGPFKSNTDN